MRKLEFVKSEIGIKRWTAKTLLGNYVIFVVKDKFMLDYGGIDLKRQSSTIATDTAVSFDDAVKKAQEHSDEQIKLILDWVNDENL